MAGQDIQRREVLRIMAMAAAAATFPGFTKWAFAGSHPPTGALQIKPATYKLQFFSAEEYALVDRLTDLIIPSHETPVAREAGVAEFVDHMIVHDPGQQNKYRTGLTWLTAHAE